MDVSIQSWNWVRNAWTSVLSKTKKSMPKVWAHTGFADVARALFSALHHLHTRRLLHLDIKPENIMRFGTCWKLIDLECCMQIDAGTFVSIDDITPLYASPELAEAVIAAYNVGATTLLPPTSARIFGQLELLVSTFPRSN